MKGSLEFADAHTAKGAFATLVRGMEQSGFVKDVVGLASRTISIEHDNFVSTTSGDDAASLTWRLREIAKLAVAGAVRIETEGDPVIAIRAPRVVGDGGKKGDGLRFSVRGQLVFPDAAKAMAARDAIAQPFGRDVPRGLRASGESLSLSWSGRSDDKTVVAARRALFTWLPHATAGDVSFKHVVYTTEMHAPVPPFGPTDGELAYVHFGGHFRARSPEERAAFVESLSALPVRAREVNKLGLELKGECMVTKETFASLAKSAQRLLSRAGRGSLTLQSNWGFRDLAGK